MAHAVEFKWTSLARQLNQTLSFDVDDLKDP